MMVAEMTTCADLDDQRGTSPSERYSLKEQRRKRAIHVRTVRSRLRAIAGWGGMHRRDEDQNPSGRNCTAGRQTSEVRRNCCLGHRSVVSGAGSAMGTQRGGHWLVGHGGTRQLCGKQR